MIDKLHWKFGQPIPVSRLLRRVRKMGQYEATLVKLRKGYKVLQVRCDYGEIFLNRIGSTAIKGLMSNPSAWVDCYHFLQACEDLFSPRVLDGAVLSRIVKLLRISDTGNV